MDGGTELELPDRALPPGKLLDAIAESATEIIYTVSRSGTITSLNPAFEAVTGWSTAEWLGKHFASLVHPDDLDLATELFLQAMKGGDPSSLEVRIAAKGCNHVSVELVPRLLVVDGETVGQYGIARDVTERKRAEEALRESEEKFRSLAEALPIAAVILQGTSIAYMNPAGVSMTGYSQEELLGMSLRDVVHPDHVEHIEQRALARLRGESGPPFYDAQFVTKNGGERWGRITANVTVFNGQPAVLAIILDVTGRKRAEEALRLSEEKWRSLVENTPDFIFLVGPDMKIQYVNHVVSGLQSDDLVGTSVFDYILPEYHDVARAAMERVLATGVAETYESKGTGPDGGEAWYSSRLGPIRLGGKIVAVGNITSDITERKRAEEALRESEEKFRSLSEALPVAAVALQGTNIAYMNPAGVSMIGYSQEELLGMSLRDVVHPDHVEHIEQRALARLRGESGPPSYDAQFVTKNGEERWGRITANVTVFNGQPAVLAIVLDITERKRAEEALRTSERELAVRNKIADIFLTISDDEMYGEVLQVILDVMESRHGLFGYIDENGAVVYPSMTRNVWDQCQMASKEVSFPREVWGGIWGRALTEGKTFYSNRPYDVPEGHIPMHRSLAVPILHRGEVMGLFHVANRETDYDEKDVQLLETIAGKVAPILDARLHRDREERERKRAEEALRASEARLRSTLDSMMEGCLIIGFDWRYLYANDAIAKQTRRTKDELLGHIMMETHPGIDRRKEFAYLRGCMEERVHHRFEWEYRYPDGATAWFDVSVQPVPEGIFMLFINITERKREEAARLELREELEARVERKIGQKAPYGLTFREMTVLHLVAKGKSNKDIAALLGMRLSTALTHVEKIRGKMNVSSRTQAAVRALKERLLD